MHLVPTADCLLWHLRSCVQHFTCLHAQRFREILYGRVDKILPPSAVLVPSNIRVQENAYWGVAELIGGDVDDEPAFLVEHLHPVVAPPCSKCIKRAHPQLTVATAKSRTTAVITVPQPGCQHSRMKAGAFADGNAVRAALQARFEYPPHLFAKRFKRGCRWHACCRHVGGGGWRCHWDPGGELKPISIGPRSVKDTGPRIESKFATVRPLLTVLKP